MKKGHIALVALISMSIAGALTLGGTALGETVDITSPGGDIEIVGGGDDSNVESLSPGTQIEEVQYKGFSTNPGDYVATIYINPNTPDKFRAVWYGKTTKNDFQTFSQFYGSAFPQTLLAIKDKIADEKILVIVTNPNNTSVYVPVQCKFVESYSGSEGMDFQCVQKDQASTGGKDRQQIVDSLNTSIKSFSFLGAQKYRSPMINNPKFTAADADSDAIPDSIDSCTSANVYGESCPEQADVASGSDAEVTSTTTTETTQDAQDDAVATDFSQRFDEGGACNMVSTAPFNPMAMIVVTSGLLPLIAGRRIVRRRRK